MRPHPIGPNYDPGVDIFCTKLSLNSPSRPERVAETVTLYLGKDGKYFIHEERFAPEISADRVRGQAAKTVPGKMVDVFDNTQEMLNWLHQEYDRLRQQL
jgi:hypothetical protein